MGNDYEEFAVEYRHHTDGAVLVNDGGKERWLTRSAIRYNDQNGSEPGLFDELKPGTHIVLEVQGWLAEKSGLA